MSILSEDKPRTLAAPAGLFTITLPSARAAVRTLAAVIVFLHLANMVRYVAYWKYGHGSWKGLLPLFNVDREGNIPTLYSVLTLLASAVLAGLVAAREKHLGGRFWKHWVGIAAVFGYLAVDEGSGIHELAIPLGAFVSNTGIFFFAWIIPAAAVLLVLAVIYYRMIFSLPAWFRNLAIASAAIFISGAMGLEMVAAPIFELSGKNAEYQLITAGEEFLEMSGVALWIYALLRYLAARPALVVALRFAPGANKDSLTAN